MQWTYWRMRTVLLLLLLLLLCRKDAISTAATTSSGILHRLLLLLLLLWRHNISCRLMCRRRPHYCRTLLRLLLASWASTTLLRRKRP